MGNPAGQAGVIRNSAAGALKSAPSRANMPSNSAVLAIEGCTETAIGVLTLTNSRPFGGEITAAHLVLLHDWSPIWSATPAIAKRGRPPLAALEPACSLRREQVRYGWVSRIIDISLLKAEAVSYYRRMTHSIATNRRDRTIRSYAGSFCNQGGLSPMGRNSLFHRL
jgi:hypothetical protein